MSALSLDGLVARLAGLGDHAPFARVTDLGLRAEGVARRGLDAAPALVRAVCGLASGAELAQLRERQSAMEHRLRELEQRCPAGAAR